MAWQQNRYNIQHLGRALTHDIQRHERQVGAATATLSHAVQLRFQAQNMGLFHHIPPYKGKNRDAALRKLIDVLRDEQPDVVGLSEMWHGPDRDQIREELGGIYPYTMEGPQGSDGVRAAATLGGIAAGAAAGSSFGPVGTVVGGILGGIEGKDAPLNGGLMLLSRHPISVSNRTIYRQGAGEDALSYKGVLHARIRPHGHPCAYDIFVSHTQNLTPIVGEDDAKDALGQQIRHMAAFIRSCRDATCPALLMGDLNVDAYDPAHKGLLELLHRELAPGIDMKPTVQLGKGQSRARVDATSETDKGTISAFNDGHPDRPADDPARFGLTSQRLDYFFTWPGLLYEGSFAEGDLYHQRWRIEEAFKRLKHCMKLECVSGLSQHALLIDVAAKVLADNLASLMCIAAAQQADLPAASRRCNRAYAAALLQRTLPRLVLIIGDFFTTLADVLHLLGANT